jgi:type IV pilus assembly protein PilO
MMATLIDKIQKIPTKTRAIGFGVFIVILLVAYIFQYQIPMNTRIKELDTALAGLQQKIRENDSKIKKLDDLRAEVKSRQLQLVILTKQLPPESEVSDLLRQIQSLVNQSGLTLKSWKPSGRKTHESGLYEEIPIAITLTGGYHNTALLFDRIGKLTRIVNILNIKMGSMKMSKDGSPEITINCTAMTFSALEKKVDAATEKKSS